MRTRQTTCPGVYYYNRSYSYQRNGQGADLSALPEYNDDMTIYRGSALITEMSDDVSSPTSRACKALHVVTTNSSDSYGDFSIVGKDFGGSVVYNSNVSMRGTYHLWGRLLDAPSFNASWDDLVGALADRSSGRLKQQGSFLVDLYQFQKTVAMVSNPFNLLKGGWRQFAKLPFGKLFKYANNVWLEGRYGWRLANFALRRFSRGCETLANSYHRNSLAESAEKLRFSSSTSLGGAWASHPRSWFDARTYENEVGGVYSFGPGDLYCEASDWTARQTLFAISDARINYAAGLLGRIQQTFGFTARDVLPAIWDVIPYSFVVDWFVNTQAIWNRFSYSQLAQAHLHSIGYSVCTERQYSVVWFPRCCNSGFITEWWYPGHSIGSTGYCRVYSRNPGIPVPDSFFSARGLSFLHALDGFALICQRAL